MDKRKKEGVKSDTNYGDIIGVRPILFFFGVNHGVCDRHKTSIPARCPAPYTQKISLPLGNTFYNLIINL